MSSVLKVVIFLWKKKSFEHFLQPSIVADVKQLNLESFFQKYIL